MMDVNKTHWGEERGNDGEPDCKEGAVGGQIGRRAGHGLVDMQGTDHGKEGLEVEPDEIEEGKEGEVLPPDDETREEQQQRQKIQEEQGF